FLALPVAASFQAIFKAYTKQYDLIDSPLLNDPKPVKKSKVIEGAEAFNEHVIRPVAQRIPRAARGSSSRIHSESESKSTQQESSQIPTSHDLDTSQTVAIPQRKNKNSTLKTGSKDLNASSEADNGSDLENPRNRWR
ncbi:MAG: AI-2E family transporter, partial [Bifidobacterium sp.]